MGSNIIMAVGALLIFGTFLSSSNRLMTTNTQIAEQNEYYISAISLGQSIIDEARTKAFDQNVIGKTFSIPDSLTSPYNLGTEAGEAFSYPDILISSSPYTSSTPGYSSTYRFNDVDDYNGYSRTVNTPRAEGYTVKVSVGYVNEKNPDVSSATRTFCKKMSVAVTSPYFPKISNGSGSYVPDTLKLYYVFNY